MTMDELRHGEHRDADAGSPHDELGRPAGSGARFPDAHAEQWAETVACRVVSAHTFGAFSALELAAPAIAASAAPGQFVMVTVPAEGFFLRRPLSLFSVRGDRVGLLVEERGRGTRELARAGVGETLELAGPLGSAYPVEGVSSALLVGGGIGCAPLQFLADELSRRGAAVTAAFGFRDLRQARAAGAFELDRLWLATEDGGVGRRGTVVDLLGDVDAPPSTVVYTCGPLPMVAAVQRWAHERGLGGFASLEAHMACGTGTCHGCVVATTEGYLRVCSEGPVFALDTVVGP
jgi:dihydroorotate dehydrogenase electron transfer subunit